MSIRDAILNASMREMFDLAQHMRKHASVARAPMPSTGDLIEHIWVWANAEPSEAADAAFAEAIGATEDEVAELVGDDQPEVDETVRQAATGTDAPDEGEVETTIAAFEPMPLSTDASVTAGEGRPEGRRARRDRRALEAARKQAEAVAEAMTDKTNPA